MPLPLSTQPASSPEKGSTAVTETSTPSTTTFGSGKSAHVDRYHMADDRQMAIRLSHQDNNRLSHQDNKYVHIIYTLSHPAFIK